MLVVHSENLVLAPRLVERFDEPTQRAIETLFDQTSNRRDVSYNALPRFSLFGDEAVLRDNG